MNQSKSLTPRQNELARNELRKLVERRFPGKQADAAKALGVSQPTLANFLSGARGLGPKLMRGIARIDSAVAGLILGGVSMPEGDQTVAPTEQRQPARRDARDSHPRGRLSSVRDYLYARHAKQIVDGAIAESEFIDAPEIDELEALNVLDQRIRVIEMGMNSGQTALDIEKETRELVQRPSRRG